MANYPTLCTIVVNHAFFAGGYTEDFSLRPDESTAALLRGYKMLAKERGNTTTVLFEAIDDIRTPLVPYPMVSMAQVPQRLRFYLKVLNPQVLGVSDLPDYDASKVIFMKNPNGTTVDPTTQQMTVSPKRFHYTAINGEPFKVYGPADNAGNGPLVIDETSVTGTEYEVKLDDFADGIYTLEVGTTPPATLPQLMVDANINQSVFAVIEVYPVRPSGAAVASAYSLEFGAKSAIWKYFLVHRGGVNAGTNYDIEQTGGIDFRYTDAAALATELSGLTGDAATELAQDIARIDALKEGEPAGTEVHLWRSVDAPASTTLLKVLLSDTPEVGIQLKDLNDTDEVLIPNLPNLPIDSPDRGVPVYID